MKQKKRYRSRKEIKLLKEQEPPLCKCGCGNYVTWNKCQRHWNKYIKAHQMRETKTRKKISKTHTGMKRSKEHCKNIAKAQIGKKLSPEHCKNIGKANIGKKHSEEAKEKIRKTLKGHKFSEETKNKIRKTLMGRKLPINHSKNISKALIGRKFSTKHCKNLSISTKRLFENPENHPCWRGGISFEVYPHEYKQIRKQIRNRDNHICQLCNKTKKQNGRELDVHHIDYNKKNNNPKNLITLCHICNVEANSDRKIWTRIFQNMIKKIA